jgi:hypothetical protein
MTFQVARGQMTGFRAIVRGSVDCSSSSFCYIKGMQIEGDIHASTVDWLVRRIEELKKTAERAKKPVHPFSVELNSAGGSVAAALAIGRTLRREGLGATITFRFPPRDPGVCASACVLIFAGAVHRDFRQSYSLAGDPAGSKVGIHRPYLEVPQQEMSQERLQDAYVQMLQSVRAYLREMNVSEQLAEAMFHIEPEKIRFLSKKEAEGYGLTESDTVYKELKDVQEARKLGLDRQEYMRRRSIAIPYCSSHGEVDDWMSCYGGIMTNTRPARARPAAPPAPPGAPDYSQYGRDPDPVDWSRQPLQ